ncbi:MAG: hypothetical protein ACYC61_05305 [Isosphaeraceae bacterium]
MAPGRLRARRGRNPRRLGPGIGLGEHLEQRVVLSDFGGDLLGSALNAISVVTGPVLAPSSSTSSGSSGQASQLRTDIQTLQTDLANVASNSKPTVADLTSLATDSQAILQQATSRVDLKSLDTGINELATALTTTGASTTTAVNDITSALSTGGVSSATITQTITDLTTAINDSGVTSTQLARIAADRAAIQTDLSNLKTSGDGDNDDGSRSSAGSGRSSSSGTNSPTSTPVTTTGGGSTSPTPLIGLTSGADTSTTTTNSTGSGTSSGSTTTGSTTRHKAAHRAGHFVHTAAKRHVAKPLAKFHRRG